MTNSSNSKKTYIHSIRSFYLCLLDKAYIEIQ